MGAISPQGIQQRADKAIACLYGRSQASALLAFTAGASASVSGLVSGFYIVSNPDAECFIREGGAAAADGTCEYLAQGASVAQWFGTPGSTFALHAIGRSAGGTIFLTRMDDTDGF